MVAVRSPVIPMSEWWQKEFVSPTGSKNLEDEKKPSGFFEDPAGLLILEVLMDFFELRSPKN